VEGARRQGLLKERGVVLRRVDTPEGNRRVYLFLAHQGPLWASAPGAARGKVRFGGSTEPMVWGIMHLYRGPNRYYLRDVDVRKDFWSLRARPGAMRRAVEWIRTVSLALLPMHPCDELLPILYWSLCSLEDEAVPGAVFAVFRKPNPGSCQKKGFFAEAARPTKAAFVLMWRQ